MSVDSLGGNFGAVSPLEEDDAPTGRLRKSTTSSSGGKSLTERGETGGSGSWPGDKPEAAAKEGSDDFKGVDEFMMGGKLPPSTPPMPPRCDADVEVEVDGEDISGAASSTTNREDAKDSVKGAASSDMVLRLGEAPATLGTAMLHGRLPAILSDSICAKGAISRLEDEDDNDGPVTGC